MTRLRFSVALVLGAALATTAACSSQVIPIAAGGPQSASSGPATTTAAMPAPADLLATVRSASESASAVHVKGSFVDSGDSVSVDMQLNKDGSASGTVSLDGSTFPLLVVDNVYYIQFTKGVMAGNGISPTSAAGKLLLNKWVPSNAKGMDLGDLVNSLKPATDYDTFIPMIFDQIKSADDAPKPTGTDTVDGVPVEVYTFSDNSKADVATAAPHYLIEAAEPPTEGKGKLDFTGWDQPVKISAPPARDIFTVPSS